MTEHREAEGEEKEEEMNEKGKKMKEGSVKRKLEKWGKMYKKEIGEVVEE